MEILSKKYLRINKAKKLLMDKVMHHLVVVGLGDDSESFQVIAPLEFIEDNELFGKTYGISILDKTIIPHCRFWINVGKIIYTTVSGDYGVKFDDELGISLFNEYQMREIIRYQNKYLFHDVPENDFSKEMFMKRIYKIFNPIHEDILQNLPSAIMDDNFEKDRWLYSRKGAVRFTMQSNILNINFEVELDGERIAKWCDINGESTRRIILGGDYKKISLDSLNKEIYKRRRSIR